MWQIFVAFSEYLNFTKSQLNKIWKDRLILIQFHLDFSLSINQRVIEFVGPTTEKNKKSKERIEVGDPTEVRLECANLY